MKHSRSLTLVLISIASTSAVAAIDDATRQQGYRLSDALDSGTGSAVDEVIALADAQPDMVVYFFNSWTASLVKMKRYDAVYKLADAVTQKRPYAWPEVADAQRARTAPLIDEGKFDQALIEAKRNYALCILSRTDDAVALLALAMRGRDAKAEPVIQAMVAEQSAAVPKGRSMAADLLPAPSHVNATQPAGGVLGTITSDAKPFDELLAGDIGSNDFENWFGHGNLLLLGGKPGEAKGWFRKIAEAEGMSTQQLTRAIEGVARCIRAEDGNPARANAFVADVQKKP